MRHHLPETLSVHVPFTIRKRGGRKEIVMPKGTPAQRPRVDNTMIKALARAFRWKRMLESGAYATLHDLAVAERINLSYLGRVLRLTLLASDVVEAILEGRQGDEMTLAAVLSGVAVEWGRK